MLGFPQVVRGQVQREAHLTAIGRSVALGMLECGLQTDGQVLWPLAIEGLPL